MKIGITGSLASGKTTVTKLIGKEKFPIFNADLIVKNLYKNKSFVRKLTKKFKIKGKRNFKKVISKMIVNKEIELKNLEKIIHPIVRKNMVSFANKNKKKKKVLFEIPLLIERIMKETLKNTKTKTKMTKREQKETNASKQEHIYFLLKKLSTMNPVYSKADS